VLLEFVYLFIGCFIDLLKHFNRGICDGGERDIRKCGNLSAHPIDRGSFVRAALDQQMPSLHKDRATFFTKGLVRT
jgi:hypothetical protein